MFCAKRSKFVNGVLLFYQFCTSFIFDFYCLLCLKLPHDIFHIMILRVTRTDINYRLMLDHIGPDTLELLAIVHRNIILNDYNRENCLSSFRLFFIQSD